MSTNKIIDVWDENGYMMQSCLAYEEAYVKVSDYLNSLIALNTLGGSVTLTPKGVDKLGKAISNLLVSSKQAIDDKSERLRTVEQQRKGIATEWQEVRRIYDEKKD